VFSNRVEGAAYLGQFVLLVSPLMVLWENIDWRRAGWVAGVLILVTMALANFGHGYTSLYVDHLLGAWFAGVLLNFSLSVRAQGYRRLYFYIVPLAAIVLFKSTGLFFAVACSGLMGLLLLNRESARVPKATVATRLLKSAALPVAASLLSIALLGAWSVNRDAAGISKSVDSTSGIAGSLLQRESVLTAAEQQELTRRFVDVMLHHQISKDEMSAQFNAFSYSIMPLFKDGWRLTTATLLALSLTAILLMWRWLVPDDRRTQWLITGGGTWLMAVAYIVVLYLGYRYIANDPKALELSSYVRYAHSMLLPLVLVTFSPLLPAFGDGRGPLVQVGEGLAVSRNALVFAVALAAFLVFERPYLKPLYSVQQPPLLRTQLEPMTAGIRSTIEESSVWVYFPNNLENGFVGQVLQYLLTPGRTYVEERADHLLYDPAALIPELRHFQYAWFPAQSPEIDAALKELAGELPPTRLFRVVVSGDELHFEAVPEMQPQTLAETD